MSALFFIFHEEEVLLFEDRQSYQIPQFESAQAFDSLIEQQFFLGNAGKQNCYALTLSQKPKVLPSGHSFQAIRQSHALLNDDMGFNFIVKAKQLINWDKNTRFCGRCGHVNQLKPPAYVKCCANCQFMTFPQIAPAMLVLIWRQDELLLARSPQFNPGIYSILAGFVDPGETLEQTVEREVFEEVGIKIKNLQYVGSQPWPFPSSNLMLGFKAEYASGEIQFDTNELEDAQWFHVNNLPPLPKPISLSRLMIDEYLQTL